MKDVITVGKRHVPLEEIALVEPFDPSSNPEFKPEKEYRSRIVLLNRDTILAETATQELAEAHGFRMLSEDRIAVNAAAIAFRVESFAPSENFNPTKAYATRLKWRDRDGNEQSKLLLTPPESVIAVVLRGEAEPSAPKGPPRRPSRARRNARRLEPATA